MMEFRKPGMSQAIDKVCPRNGKEYEAAGGSFMQFGSLVVAGKAQEYKRKSKGKARKGKRSWVKVLRVSESLSLET